MMSEACPDCIEQEVEKKPVVYKAKQKKSKLSKEFLKYAYKWARSHTKKGEMFLVKDLQHSPAHNTEWLGNFRINWYIEKVSEDALSTITIKDISRSYFIHIIQKGNGYAARICDIKG
ncbi:MAG: hypothetical protein ACOC5T_01455 [Elusimicrobiota bacterium]